MRQVELVDTSILVEILNVPGRNANRRTVLEQLGTRQRDESISLMLPTATVIETGNHIHRVSDGRARRACAQAFAAVLAQTVAGQAPWTLLNARWDGPLLMRSGAAPAPEWIWSSTRRRGACRVAT
jgi:hypothetical protein